MVTVERSTRRKRERMHYDDARKLLTGANGRERATKKVGNNTVARLDGDDVVLRLHATDIMRWSPVTAGLGHPAGSELTLNTGGWYSVTTKQRMNHYGAPFQVWATNGTWMVSAYLGNGTHTPAVPFFDGMTLDTLHPIDAMERLHGSPDAMRAAELLEADKAMKRRISGYVRGITADMLKGWVGESMAGDCLFCQLEWSNPDAGMGGTDHLLSHIGAGPDGMEEIYYMPTLTLSALREAGYPDPALIVSMGFADMVRRALKRYLAARLLVGPSSGRRQSARISGAYGS